MNSMCPGCRNRKGIVGQEIAYTPSVGAQSGGDASAYLGASSQRRESAPVSRSTAYRSK